MKKFTHGVISLVLALSLALAIYEPVSAVTFSWSGAPIDRWEDPLFLPDGSAQFIVIDSSSLQIILTNNTTQEIKSIGEVLAGLTWDITDTGVVLDPVSALIVSGSQLVGANLPAMPLPTDLSSEWAFKDDINAGSGAGGPIGSFGIGTVGDINFGPGLGGDQYDNADRIDTTTNLFGPANINGIDAGIVGANVDFAADGLPSHGPLVQGMGPGPGQMIFTFNITAGTLTENEIANVQPLFGTEGATVPEPSSLVLLGTGLVGLGFLARKRWVNGIKS